MAKKNGSTKKDLGNNIKKKNKKNIIIDDDITEKIKKVNKIDNDTIPHLDGQVDSEDENLIDDINGDNDIDNDNIDNDNEPEIDESENDESDKEDDNEEEADADAEAEADAEADDDKDDYEDKADKKEDYDEYDDDKCFYKYADDKSMSDEEFEITFDDDNLQEKSDIVPKDQRITKPFLYKYERVRLLGDRIKQLTLGAKPMIKNSENLTPYEIAELELKNNIIPLIIERPLPNGKMERWYIHELKH